MKVLVVYAHPNPQSFNHAVLDAFCRGLEEGGHTREVVDLYAIGFDPRLSAEEFAQLTSARETARDVREQQEKVAWADGLAFVFPVVWMGFPAILKGWIERIFSIGFAYQVNEAGARGNLEGRIGLLRHHKALLMSTTHWSKESYERSGLRAAMQKIMVNYALEFPGIDRVEHVFLYGVLAADAETRSTYLDKAYRLGESF